MPASLTYGSTRLHKLTTRLVRTYGRVVIEDLNVKGMVHSRKLSRAISDMGFGEFRRQLSYKVGGVAHATGGG